MPKVSPPVGSSVTRQSPGNVLDKIQAELAETKRREDELRRARREMFRSQPDLSHLKEDAAHTEPEEAGEDHFESDIEVSFSIQPSAVSRPERLSLPGGGQHPVSDAHQGKVSPDFCLGEQDPV